ncbi:MAG: LamG domain-containing protein, partial [Sphingomonas sp.]
YPNEINWDTDATRVGDGGGVSTPLQAAWASWRFTGDDKYLRPIAARLGKSASGIAELNENAFDLMPGGAALRARIAKAAGNDPFARYAAWAASGDPAPLAALHADAWVDKTQHQYMYTEGHWWSDRVEQPNEILQRERLGGIALRRNQSWPGNTVSWRFAEDGAAEQVAILVPNPTREAFKVIAYNTGDRPQRATMATWNVTAGEWSVAVDGKPAATVPLERSAGTEVTFAPHATTVIEAKLLRATTPVEKRPDIGIGRDDVVVAGRRVTLTVHGLGSVPSGAGRATLVTPDGRTVASGAIPPIAAPTDLTPRTVTVRLAIPAGIDAQTLTARVALAGDAAEVTQANNIVAPAR